MIYLEGIPPFVDCAGTLSLCVSGRSVYIRCARFIARCCLTSGKIDWLEERSPPTVSESTYHHPRRINLFGSGSELWVDEQVQIAAEIISTECGGFKVCARHATTGAQLWEYLVPTPEAADWAEATPAWPGAQTEDIDGFIAKDPKRLIVCLSRQSRRSMIFSPQITVSTLPQYGCQTDAIRLDLSTGIPIWRAAFHDVHVGIVERRAFTGIWAKTGRLGMIDFETGSNTILHEVAHSLGWPVRDGTHVAVPWHSKREVGIDWIDERGCRVRHAAWRHARVLRTYLHPTESGLGMQTNDQAFWWLDKECLPLWNVRTKAYIYQVKRGPETDVFIGTDGNGGRLLGFDTRSGRETLNLKPALGGVGHLAKIPGHGVLVSTFCVSRSYSVLARLLVLSMKDRRYQLENECFLILGTWEHGVVCRAGRNGERLAVIDIRS